MAAWITIYAKSSRPVPPAENIRTALGSDWWTLGEMIDLDEDAVDAVMTKLVWKADAIREPGTRGLVLHVWDDAARVRTELEELAEHAPPVPASVRARLANVRTVIAIELGFFQTDSMLEIVAFEIAYHLAETHDGVIRSDDGRWFDHDGHRWEPFE